MTAAFDLVGEIGYAKLSIEGIAARAGVGKQTIYRWWPSKGAVLFDAFLMMSEGEAGELPDTGDLEADLKAVLRATIAELRDERYDLPMRALNSEMMHDAELARTYAERLDVPMREMKKARLRKAVEAGQLSDVDLDLAVDVIWSPVTVRWMNRSGPLTEEFADTVVETALAGLRP
ncbi:TetR/AcrR family transcriptional regulator [Amycolatopsis endophytica]|uniref:TetR/AcrR family transcriptional regulator n=1 Tax=Amycolatopsis endophytica TaxID=860233 RepID=UPI001C5479CB|nr:TetR/AcrR family transcriptional regulator [Amycolatopsis endophytica]